MVENSSDKWTITEEYDLEDEPEEVEDGNIRIYDYHQENIISSYMNEIKHIPLLTPQKERMLAIRMSRGDKKARDELVVSNLKLVVSISRHYIGLGLSFLDLIQEGNIGLMKAADKFDWKRGYRFSTYATYWIKKAISRAISVKSKTIKIPIHTLEKVVMMRRIEDEYIQKHGAYPDVEYIAYEMDLPKDKVERMRAFKETFSLDRELDKNATLEDFVVNEDAQSPEEYTYREMFYSQIGKILDDNLDPREAAVIRMRYGLDGPKQSLAAVGRRFGITRERVRQIEAEALEKLRKSLEDWL